MNLKLAAIFRDHMVVQRNKAIAVFGTGTPHCIISVSLHTSATRTKVTEDGTWCAMLPPLSVGEGYSLIVSDGTEQCICKDIAVGEVWLAGGQSNMEMALLDSANGAAVCKAYNGTQIRFYQVPKRAVVDTELAALEAKTTWKIAASENVGEMSAVAFYFAQKLTEKLDCVIGIVDCYWGGTSVACWMSRRTMENFTVGQAQLAAYKEQVGAKTAEQYAAEMQEYDAAYQHWQTQIDACRTENPDITWNELHERCGECPWPQPTGWQSPFCPNNLHTSMILRIAPYTLRGFLYYQGEEDVSRYAGYSDMLNALVKQWRMDWNDWELPFLFVQLPMYIAVDAEEDGIWAMQREQQSIANAMLKNASMIALTDCGEFDNIHPLDKKTPGQRLAQLAEQMVYGNGAEITPTVQTMYTDGIALYVTFSHITDTLVLKETDSQTCFVAGMDDIFYPAEVELTASDTIRIFSPSVDMPQSVKYAWYNYGEAAWFTKNGLAVPSFRKTLFVRKKEQDNA